MTNKQIIIDGVDVSKCIYFQQEDDEYTCSAEECNGAIVACRACDNCYYKQLKAKEQRIVELIKSKKQECERLKSAFVRAECQIADDEILQCDMREAIEELKAENEKLKKAYQRLNNMYNDNCNFTGKLEQTLAEIKELLLKTPTDSSMHCVNAKSVILQKISECEGNNEYS